MLRARLLNGAIAGVVMFALAACETGGPFYSPRQEARAMRDLVEGPSMDGGRAALLRYDIDKNGAITREEMNSTLAADFLTADANGNRKLDTEETRGANEKRWAIEASQSTPLIDWNQDGAVDMQEFSNSVRALFERFDTNYDDMVSQNELNVRRLPPQRKDWRSW